MTIDYTHPTQAGGRRRTTLATVTRALHRLAARLDRLGDRGDTATAIAYSHAARMVRQAAIDIEREGR